MEHKRGSKYLGRLLKIQIVNINLSNDKMEMIKLSTQELLKMILE